MPVTWQTKQLGEVCDFYNGLWKGKEPPYIHVGVIRNTNITKEGRLDDAEIAFLDVEKKQFAKRKLEYGDIVLEKSGGGPKQPVGRVIVFDKKDGDFSFSNFTSVIRVKDQRILDFNFLHKFLFYSYISGVTEGMQSHSTGIRNLDLHAYKEIEAPIPPLNEQKRIVKRLEEVFEKVTKAKEAAEKNLQNSKELFESYIQSIFANPGKDWGEKNLPDISKNLDGKRIPVTKRVRSSGKYPYYGASGIVDYVGEYIFDDDLLLVSEDGANLLARTYPIAFSISGKSWVNNHAHVLKFEKNESQKFVEYYLNSIKLDPYVSGMAQPKLNQKMLNSIPVPYPSFSEQKDIVTKFNALSVETKKLEKIYEQKLADLEELKKSILSKAFHAEL
jgi:type I restriction enzyme S subunit